MKLIFINSFFYPDHSATSQLLSELAFALAAAGDDVSIICSRSNYTDPTIRYAKQETVRGVKIHRVATPAFGRSRLFGRALDTLSFYATAMAWLYRLADANTLVVVKTDPPLIGLPAALVCRLKHAKQINWLQDLFPETAIALGIRPFTGPVGKLTKAARNWALRSADANIVIAEQMRKTLRDEGIDDRKLHVIPNWANGSAIVPVVHHDNPLRQQWRLSDAFVVSYSGNLGRAHEFDTLLSAAITLQDAPNIRFLFIGGGALIEQLQQAVRHHGLQNVIFKPYQSLDQLPLSLGVADVHVVSLRPDMQGAVSPSKYYGIAAAGRACLYVGDSNDAIPQHLARTQSGITVSVGDGAGLATQIRSLQQNQTHIGMGKNARRAFETEFDFPLALARWRSALQDVAATES